MTGQWATFILQSLRLGNYTSLTAPPNYMNRISSPKVQMSPQRELLTLDSFCVQPWNSLVKELSVFNYVPVALQFGLSRQSHYEAVFGEVDGIAK